MGIEIKKARCVIIGSAPVDEAERRFIGTQVSPEDFLVCADGGYETARRLGLQPNLLIGDLDSCTEDFPPDIEAVRLPVQKDDTDMMYSLKECLGRGYRDFLLLGATGGQFMRTVLFGDAQREGSAGGPAERDGSGDQRPGRASGRTRSPGFRVPLWGVLLHVELRGPGISPRSLPALSLRPYGYKQPLDQYGGENHRPRRAGSDYHG
jgi:hypothetical protein